MSTELKYLEDTYLYTFDTELIGVDKDENGEYVVFLETIFYPQGGGQESDTGTITVTSADGHDAQFQVTFVKFVNGQVRHYGNFGDLMGVNINGSGVSIELNAERRLRNAKLHSAGHLVASIVEQLDNRLRANKGFHFSQGSYVNFEILDKHDFDKEAVLDQLNAKIVADIDENLPVSSEIVSYEVLKERCAYIPGYLPKDKPLRVVTMGAYEPIPCGGTHIDSLEKLRGLVVSKAKKKGGDIRISYSVN